MIIKFDLTPETEARLVRYAAEAGRSVSDCVAMAVERLIARSAPNRFSYGERMIATMMADWLDSLASETQMAKLRVTLAPTFVVEALKGGRNNLIGEHYSMQVEGCEEPVTLYQTVLNMLDTLSLARRQCKEIPLFTGISDNDEAEKLANFVFLTHPDYTRECDGVNFNLFGSPQPLAYWLELAGRYEHLA